MTSCLLVDDDPAIRNLLLDYLQGFGFQVDAVADGAAMRRRLAGATYELLLLDLMLPDEDGLALCQWAKREWPTLPVIMLTAQGDPLSRVVGLELGADDYLPKPFEPRELVARMKAVLRRGGSVAAAAPTAPVHFEGWGFDRLRRELVGPDGTLLPLSAAEFRLLAAFVDHPGRVLSRHRLITLTRTGAAEVTDRSIDLAVSRLRGKLGDTQRDPPLIATVRGEGYRFDAKLD
ncbi:MAG: response regulator transcription factor [Burkholderiales bacterium]|nr:response regulator transcription factor [Burkholderiales bacterium]